MVSSILAVERFQIRSDPDTAYLPYSLDIMFDDGGLPHYVNPMSTRLRVLTPAVMGVSQGRYTRGSNSSSGQGGWFTDHIYPEMKDTDDDGIGGVIGQWMVCKDDETGEDAII